MKWIIRLVLLGFWAPGDAQQIAFSLPEKDLVPECIAWSKKEKVFYLTSIHKHKIIRYDPASKIATDFIKTNQDGYDAGIGLIIDEKRGRIWSACGSYDGKEFTTGIFAWDMHGQLLKKYLTRDTMPSLFNDLALDPAGNVYVTNTYDSKVYFFNINMQQPKVYLTDMGYPNGISMGPGNSLFIATYTKGIVKVDIKTKSLTELESDTLLHTSKGLDGLKCYKKSLIGVYNGSRELSEHKLIRYYLTKKNSKISSVKIIDEKNPDFLLPTTGIIVKNYYYLIANTNLSLLEQTTNTFPDRNKLRETKILKYKLR